MEREREILRAKLVKQAGKYIFKWYVNIKLPRCTWLLAQKWLRTCFPKMNPRKHFHKSNNGNKWNFLKESFQARIWYSLEKNKFWYVYSVMSICIALNSTSFKMTVVFIFKDSPSSIIFYHIRMWMQWPLYLPSLNGYQVTTSLAAIVIGFGWWCLDCHQRASVLLATDSALCLWPPCLRRRAWSSIFFKVSFDWKYNTIIIIYLCENCNYHIS